MLRFACAETALGSMLVAATPVGVCWAAMADGRDELVRDVRKEFVGSELVEDVSLESVIAAMMKGTERVELDLRGTAFQLRVWQALREIPRGQTVSYTELAMRLDAPRAVRAVAAACARNRVAIAVPCHRVLGARGALTGYRWGLERKRRLLEMEAS